MRATWITITILLVTGLISSVYAEIPTIDFSEFGQQPAIDLSDVNHTYNFAVNISISGTHKAKYLTPFSRPGNFTIHYKNLTKQEQGVTPRLQSPQDLEYDEVRSAAPVLLDPRTCPNDLAYCYQVIEHSQNRTTFGKNYTAVSGYVLPATRIKTFVCVGNDTSCVRSATNCFCPAEKIPTPPLLLGSSGKCSSSTHLCQSSYGSFVMCNGNLTECQKHYTACGCGPTTSCAAGRNTCLNARNELVLCKGALSDCISKYSTCYCGADMIIFQKGCTTAAHQCIKDEKIYTCYGSLASCAPSFDKCDC
jgi:hypothetical protein